jgi:hypothetical protein
MDGEEPAADDWGTSRHGRSPWRYIHGSADAFAAVSYQRLWPRTPVPASSPSVAGMPPKTTRSRSSTGRRRDWPGWPQADCPSTAHSDIPLTVTVRCGLDPGPHPAGYLRAERVDPDARSTPRVGAGPVAGYRVAWCFGPDVPVTTTGPETGAAANRWTPRQLHILRACGHRSGLGSHGLAGGVLTEAGTAVRDVD